LNPWEKAAWCLTIGLEAAVLVKFWSTGLLRIYKLLFSYLLFDCLANIAGMAIPYHTNAYGYYYFFAQTVKIAIAAVVCVEIYSLALEHHPALARFGRGAVGYILGAAALLPFIVLLVDRGSNGPHPYLRTYFLFEQTMDLTMAIFLLLISVFMTWFPVRMRRNVVVYIGGFVVWALTRSAAVHMTKQLLGNVHAIKVVNSIQLCVPLGCLVFWLVGFRAGGENRTAVVGHLWNRAEADRLTGQLDAINDSLERLRRK
jgi:hypothetical protein